MMALNEVGRSSKESIERLVFLLRVHRRRETPATFINQSVDRLPRCADPQSVCKGAYKQEGIFIYFSMRQIDGYQSANAVSSSGTPP
jgi:hypothetical protein